MENEEVQQMHTRSHQWGSRDGIVSVARTRTLAVVLAAALGLAGFLVATSTARSANRSGATVSLRKTTLGMVLVAANGHTIYLFGKDRQDKSACSASCAQFWPPLLSRGKPTAGPGVRAALLGTTKRANGSLQVSYNKHPLYTYVLDKRAGQTKGEGISAFGAKWYALSAKGVAIIRSTTTTTTTTTTTSTTTPYP
jgi:predicted lipoprotein with Yx(FWY)xxD motif